jgi:hypothetical protein
VPDEDAWTAAGQLGGQAVSSARLDSLCGAREANDRKARVLAVKVALEMAAVASVAAAVVVLSTKG